MQQPNALAKTTFVKIPADAQSHEVIATVFTRVCFVAYLVYAAWGGFTAFGEIPTMRAIGSYFQSTYSMMIVAVALTAAFGALFFPRHARTEMYAASILTAFVGVYITVVIYTSIGGGAASSALIGFAIFCLVALLLPGSRVAVIIWLLLRQARGNCWNHC